MLNCTAVPRRVHKVSTATQPFIKTWDERFCFLSVSGSWVISHLVTTVSTSPSSSAAKILLLHWKQIKSPDARSGLYPWCSNILRLPAIFTRHVNLFWCETFVNCNWVATRWQYYSTHLHTNSTQYSSTTVHIYTQTVHRTAVLQYTFTHKQYTVQQYSTHLHTNSTQYSSTVHIYTQTVHSTAVLQYTFTHKQYIEQHK